MESSVVNIYSPFLVRESRNFAKQELQSYNSSSLFIRHKTYKITANKFHGLFTHIALAYRRHISDDKHFFRDYGRREEKLGFANTSVTQLNSG